MESICSKSTFWATKKSWSLSWDSVLGFLHVIFLLFFFLCVPEGNFRYTTIFLRFLRLFFCFSQTMGGGGWLSVARRRMLYIYFLFSFYYYYFSSFFLFFIFLFFLFFCFFIFFCFFLFFLFVYVFCCFCSFDCFVVFFVCVFFVFFCFCFVFLCFSLKNRWFWAAGVSRSHPGVTRAVRGGLRGRVWDQRRNNSLNKTIDLGKPLK